MFQPSMLGMEQAGLAEVIEFILKKYPPEIQNNLVQVGFVATVTWHVYPINYFTT